MTPEEKKELEYIKNTAFKCAIGILIITAALFIISILI